MFFQPIPVYTTKLMNTHPNITPLGIIIGNNMERVSLPRALADDYSSFTGGRSGLMRKKMDDLVKNGLKDLQKNVAKEFPQATAIYNAEFHFNTMEGGNPDLIKAGSSIIHSIINPGIITNMVNITSSAETTVSQDNQTRNFELTIIGTAVIEKKKRSKTRRSSKRK